MNESKRAQNSDELRVKRFETRDEMGQGAASDIAAALQQVLARKARARMIFAAAPSQSDMLEQLIALSLKSGIDWQRVTAFHMDEYVGLATDAPQSFANWLDRHLFTRLPFGTVHRLAPGAHPLEAARDYAQSLNEAPIDLVCLGVGVNGHIAFNDPPVADFNDPLDVKQVELDAICRQQQVDDGCFATFDAVPRHALTLTVPRLLRAGKLFCVVPGSHKRAALHAMLTGPIATSCPASILRTHPDCTLYVDKEADPR